MRRMRTEQQQHGAMAPWLPSAGPEMSHRVYNSCVRVCQCWLLDVMTDCVPDDARHDEAVISELRVRVDTSCHSN